MRMLKQLIIFRYMSSFEDRSVIHSAMKQHKSQIVWFRRVYMFFSRYMLINSLQQMNLVDIELDLELDEWIVPFFVNFWIKYVLLKGNIYYTRSFWNFVTIIALWIVDVCFLLLKCWRFVVLITIRVLIFFKSNYFSCSN